MWMRNFHDPKVHDLALTIDERTMFGEFLGYDNFQDAVAFSVTASAATKSLKRLMESLGHDAISWRAVGKLASGHVALWDKMALASLRDLFPMKGFSRVSLLHV
jgi:hypothetical protein